MNTSEVVYLVQLPLIREAVDLCSILVRALAHNIPPSRHVGDPDGSLLVGDDRLGEAPLPLLESEECLLTRKSEPPTVTTGERRHLHGEFGLGSEFTIRRTVLCSEHFHL